MKRSILGSIIDNVAVIVLFAATFISMAPKAVEISSDINHPVVKIDINGNKHIYRENGSYTVIKKSSQNQISEISSNGNVSYAHVDSKGNISTYNSSGDSYSISRTQSGIKILHSNGNTEICKPDKVSGYSCY